MNLFRLYTEAQVESLYRNIPKSIWNYVDPEIIYKSVKIRKDQGYSTEENIEYFKDWMNIWFETFIEQSPYLTKGVYLEIDYS